MEGDLVPGPYMLDLQILLTVVVAGTWWALYRPLLTRPHYRWWAWGWTVFLVFLISVRISMTGMIAPWVTRLTSAPAGLLQVACFALGAEALRRGEEVPRRDRWLWLGLAAGAGVVVSVLHLPVRDQVTTFTVRTLVRSPGLALALGYCGWLFLRRREDEPGAGVWLTAGGFLLYALDHAVYTLGAANQGLALAAGVDVLGFGVELVVSETLVAADMAWEAAVGVGAILLLVEDKNRLYRISRRNERRFQAVFRGSVDGILVADREGRIRAANPAALEMLGFEDEDRLAGRDLQALQSPNAEHDLPGLDEVRSREGIMVETAVRTRRGEDLPVELSISAYRLEDRVHLQAIMRDISARKALMDELAHRASHRSLTDLPNRRHVRREIDRALAAHRRGAPPPGLLFLDLDGFKEINDTHGHDVGDELLRAVADRLEASVRETELVGHPGGDEFVVLIENCPDEETLRRIGRRIGDALSAPYDRIEPGLRVPVSIGGALGREDDDYEDLLRRADRAMYRVKRRRGDGLALAAEG